MATSMNEETGESYFIVQCPFSIITGCDHITVFNGYCTSGKYCVKDCSYAWAMQDDA